MDFVNGAWGTILGLAGVEVWPQRARWGTRLAYVVLVVAGIIPAFRPAFMEVRGILWRQWNFPLMAGFEVPVEMTAWHPVGGGKVMRTQEHPSAGTWALRLDLEHGTLPGVEFVPGNDMDWRGFATLRFDVFISGPPVALTLRVDDDGTHSNAAERAQWTARLATGSNQIVIPLAALLLVQTAAYAVTTDSP